MLGCSFPGRLLLVAALACAPALSIPFCAAQNQNQNQQPTYPVDGIVLNSLTHQPIARVLVSAMNSDVLTDSEGRFELQLPEETIQIRLRRPGYAGQQPFGLSDSFQTVKIAAGMAPLTLYLTPAASITAHVELSTGDEPDGIRFTLYRKGVIEGRPQWLFSSQATTDSQGVVRFLSLNPSIPYVICSGASPDQPGPAAPGVTVYGYPGTCFPGGADFASASASPLTLQPGQQAQFDVDLVRQPFYPVSISVAGTAPGHTSYVQVYDQTGQPFSLTAIPRSFANGVTVLNLPNGSYYAEARTGINSGSNAESGPSVQRYGRVDFTVAGGPVSGLTVVPLPQAPLTVQIQRDFTADTSPPAQPAYSEGSPDNTSPGVMMSLVPIGSPMGGNYGGNLRPAPGSAYGDLYQWQVTAQGRFWVHVEVLGQDYVSSITSGGIDLASQPLVIGPGGTADPIQITLRNDMGRLSCALALPPPSPSASGAGEINPVFIYAIPLFPSVERIQQIAVQPSGQPSYAISLPPGNYLVVAASTQQEIDLDDPQQMARFAAQGQKVTIQPGETATVQLNSVLTDAPQAASAEASQ